eukprot:6652418-Prymnesium_polylepis.3
MASAATGTAGGEIGGWPRPGRLPHARTLARRARGCKASGWLLAVMEGAELACECDEVDVELTAK